MKSKSIVPKGIRLLNIEIGIILGLFGQEIKMKVKEKQLTN